MVWLKNEDELSLIRNSSRLVGKTLGYVSEIIGPGKTTKWINQQAEKFIRDHDAIPAFLNYNGFPATLCISINDKVVHGIPSEDVIREGDIVSVDCGVVKSGFYGDSAYTFAIGEIPESVTKLLRITKESLYLGIEKAISGNRIGDISQAVQSHAESNGFSVVRELVGHGVGRHLHEKPEVPNFGKQGHGMKMKSGLVIAIEPMINMGKKEIYQWNDGWTISTTDKQPSAHFEHTVVVRDNKAEILSTFEFIKNEI
jgi:methionyl aminopeptidase